MNPFSVKTPETLTPKNIADLFIDVFSDFPRLLSPEHTFLHGARGTGKSMMLRYLEPSVQLAANNVALSSELEYFAVHMPIKSANYSLSELERLDGAPYFLMAEHFLVSNASIHILSSIESLIGTSDQDKENDIEGFYKAVMGLLDDSGVEVNSSSSDDENDHFKRLSRFIECERSNAKKYIAKLAFTEMSIPYDSALFDYEEFFLPFVRLVRMLSVTPSGPIYLMLDDADNLPVRMQNIINGWVSYRSTNDVCLKISTQQKYKTWRTSQGVLIESSHDFSEIDISAVYTSKHFSHYYERVEQIVKRRLEVNNFSDTNPLSFFPIDKKQVEGLEVVKQQIVDRWENGDGVSSRKSDDITRYKTSEYMKYLSTLKKTNTYSYSGFKSLVDISSGMIRYFLESAARMYAEIEATDEVRKITLIPPEIQDRIIYKWSEEFVLEEFDRLKKDETNISLENINKVERLKRLINAIGQIFQRKLLSSDSERRFISFMLSDYPEKEEQEILDLAVEWGYLSTKTIARKEGVGRNILYVLNRRLAPYFKLDPSGYASHMSIKPGHLKLAINNPNEFVKIRLGLESVSVIEQQAELDV